MRKILSIFIFTSFLFATDSIEDSIADALNQAAKLNLHEYREWKILLHIDKNKSEIISPFFFLSKSHNAKDELDSLIKDAYKSVESVEIPQVIIKRRQEQIELSKNSSVKLPLRSIQKEDYHPVCRFPARMAFLQKHINFKNLHLPKCLEYKEMLEYIQPSKATIVFPAAHINSPASMFGHTFLLLDSSFSSRLLAFAINYQADSNPNVENGFIFAFKGLFGFYTGSYSILPYYDKIKEYNNSENRDMWEYELNFNKDEILRMYAHIWELSDAYSWYYFFNRNCSYNILWLLESARDDIYLRDKFIYQVNPPESLFALQDLGLISKITYRPSKASKLNAYAKVMKQSEVNLSKKLSKGKLDSIALLKNATLNTQQKQYILESSIELSEYYFLKSKLDKEEYTKIAHNLASARSSLGQSKEVPIKTPTNPLDGNQGLRVSPMALYADSSLNPALEFRLAYHDASDSDKGYLKGASIEFLKLLAYYDIKDNTPKIYEANLLQLASISMINKFFTPISYRLNIGANRNFLTPNLAYNASIGVGFATQFGDFVYGYYLFEPNFFVDSVIKKADGAISNAFGLIIGGESGTKLALEYTLRFYDLNSYSHIAQGSLSVNIAKNLALFGSAKAQNYLNLNQEVYMLGIRKYF